MMDRISGYGDVGYTGRVCSGESELHGNLRVAEGAVGLVVFAHGSGSDRHSPRNRYVARVLQGGGLGTLLVDLLTPAEKEDDARTGRLRFNIDLLALRLVGVTDWLATLSETEGLGIGYFGSSTGAAAALKAAAERADVVRAVVSRGGRTDLANDALPLVRAPTLMIVGGADPAVLEMNQHSLVRMRVETALEVIPGAGHLFEEPGALERVAAAARDWFVRHLSLRPQTAAAP